MQATGLALGPLTSSLSPGRFSTSISRYYRGGSAGRQCFVGLPKILDSFPSSFLKQKVFTARDIQFETARRSLSGNSCVLLRRGLLACMEDDLSRRHATSATANNGATTSNGATVADKAAVQSPSSIIDFLSLVEKLKSQKRTGWVNHKVSGPESIADHMYRMAIMAFIAVDATGVDRNKCIKMSIVHDIAEAIVGDITPSCGVSKEEKSRRERNAMMEMCQMLGQGAASDELLSLWEEYEGNATPEAKIVKDFDKIEMILQAQQYESEQGMDLSEFFKSTEGKLQTDIGKSWGHEVCQRRLASLAAKGKQT